MFPIAVLMAVSLIYPYLLSDEHAASASRHLARILPGRTLVDHVQIRRRDSKISHLALTFDQDDVVAVYFWVQDPAQETLSTPHPGLRRILGQRVSMSGKLSINNLVPDSEVATLAWRVTHPTSCRSHVVLTWGFDKEFLPAAASEYYNLYVFAENLQTGKVSVAWEEKNVNRYLKWFSVQDLTGDGEIEIADIGRENTDQLLRIRTIHPTCEVSLIQEIEGYDIWVLPNLYRDGMAVIGVQVNRFFSDELDTLRREYRWSPKEGKFIIKR